MDNIKLRSGGPSDRRRSPGKRITEAPVSRGPLPQKNLGACLDRSQGQVTKAKVILPNYENLHSRNVMHVLRIVLGVEFDGDMHFIIRVHLGQKRLHL